MTFLDTPTVRARRLALLAAAACALAGCGAFDGPRPMLGTFATEPNPGYGAGDVTFHQTGPYGWDATASLRRAGVTEPMSGSAALYTIPSGAVLFVTLAGERTTLTCQVGPPFGSYVSGHCVDQLKAGYAIRLYP